MNICSKRIRYNATRRFNKTNILSLFKIRTKKHSGEKFTRIYGNKCVCPIANFFSWGIFPHKQRTDISISPLKSLAPR